MTPAPPLLLRFIRLSPVSAQSDIRCDLAPSAAGPTPATFRVSAFEVGAGGGPPQQPFAFPQKATFTGLQSLPDLWMPAAVRP
jgi:hypothetical protein